MKILNVTQGSPDWLAARAKHFCASDAPAMMGASKYMTRDELLRQKATGDTPTVDAVKQALYDRGHAAEAAARPVIEELIGSELYPATMTDDEGRLLASYDGITMDGETGYEHKLWSEELAAQVRAGELSPMYYWQIEQQALIGGLKRIIFVCSDGTPEKMVWMEYTPVPSRAEKLLSSWRQFDEDLKNYQRVETLPAPAGRAIMALPALTVKVMGHVTSSNLIVYQAAALDFIGAINTNLQTDQDFADAEKTVKFCADAEAELDTVKRQALAQTASIDELFRTVDTLKEAMRQKRLELDKLVKARKDTIREEIRSGGVDALAQHIAHLNLRLGKPYMPAIPADFAGVMRGKKTIASLRDAVNTEIARAKIEANAIADRIDINLKSLGAEGAGYAFLFLDMAQICLKAHDDFAALVKLRITEYKDKEVKRLDAERERIRQEEAAKITAAQPSTATPPTAPSNAGQGAVASAVSAKRKRPTDEEMIAVLANYYRTTEVTVTQWLMEFKTKQTKKRAA